MTGSYDYLTKTVARDITDYETFLMNKLKSYLASTRSRALSACAL